LQVKSHVAPLQTAAPFVTLGHGVQPVDPHPTPGYGFQHAPLQNFSPGRHPVPASREMQAPSRQVPPSFEQSCAVEDMPSGAQTCASTPTQ
jgi:hypothetical protein